jgi:hypothetical protein
MYELSNRDKLGGLKEEEGKTQKEKRRKGKWEASRKLSSVGLDCLGKCSAFLFSEGRVDVEPDVFCVHIIEVFFLENF